MRMDLFVTDWLSKQTAPFTATQLADALNENTVFKRRPWTHTRVIKRILEPLVHQGEVRREHVDRIYITGRYGTRRHTKLSVWINNNRAQAASFERGTQRIGTTPACVLTLSQSEEGE